MNALLMRILAEVLTSVIIAVATMVIRRALQPSRPA